MFEWQDEDFWDAWLRRYQGAIVECYNTGVFRGQVIKYDVKSMYPSIMVVLNLSPESVRLLSRRAFVSQTGMIKFEKRKITVSDSYVGELTIEVDEDDSITRKVMLEFMDLREQLRSSSRRDKLTKSKQLAIKILMNSLYGYNGLEFARYGSFLVAIVVTAVGRFIMQHIIKVCQDAGVTLLEADTDGLLTFGADISDRVNSHVQSLFKGFEYAKYLRVEPEYYDGAIIYSSKNYVLRRGDAILFKGSAFHGRHMPPICLSALHRFARAVFDNEPFNRVWREFDNLKNYPLREFTMNVSLNKRPDQYDSGTLYKQLADQLGDDAVWGQDITYVKTTRGYVPLGVVDDRELKRTLDYKYYRARIKQVVERLVNPIVEQEKTSLWEWM